VSPVTSKPIGCVDGFTDNELCGWIANCDHPDQPEQVICRSADGREVAFYPFVYREDVIRTIAVTGVFGFAIPLDLLAPLGSGFSVSNRHGTPLRHGVEVTLPPMVPRDRPRPPLHIFLHISKTAGTSLHDTLLRTVLPGEKMLLYPDIVPGISVTKFHQVPLAQRDRLSWIFGHCKFGLDRHVTQPSRYVTFIREPIDRLRSNFAHHLLADTRFEIDGIGLPLATVFNDGLSEECDNVMTRVLAGVGREMVPLGQVGDDEVEIALNNVRRRFCFVGRQSQAGADTLTLLRHLGLPSAPLSLENVTASIDVAESIAIDWKRIAARNRPDVRLYSRLEHEGLVSRILGG
jgi:hypothetical protein